MTVKTRRPELNSAWIPPAEALVPIEMASSAKSAQGSAELRPRLRVALSSSCGSGSRPGPHPLHHEVTRARNRPVGACLFEADRCWRDSGHQEFPTYGTAVTEETGRDHGPLAVRTLGALRDPCSRCASREMTDCTDDR